MLLLPVCTMLSASIPIFLPEFLVCCYFICKFSVRSGSVCWLLHLQIQYPQKFCLLLLRLRIQCRQRFCLLLLRLRIQCRQMLFCFVCFYFSLSKSPPLKPIVDVLAFFYVGKDISFKQKNSPPKRVRLFFSIVSGYPVFFVRKFPEPVHSISFDSLSRLLFSPDKHSAFFYPILYKYLLWYCKTSQFFSL